MIWVLFVSFAIFLTSLILYVMCEFPCCGTTLILIHLRSIDIWNRYDGWRCPSHLLRLVIWISVSDSRQSVISSSIFLFFFVSFFFVQVQFFLFNLVQGIFLSSHCAFLYKFDTTLFRVLFLFWQQSIRKTACFAVNLDVHKKPFIFLLNVFYIDCPCQRFAASTVEMHSSFGCGAIRISLHCWHVCLHVLYDYRQKFIWHSLGLVGRCVLLLPNGWASACNCSRMFTERSLGKQTMTMTNERIVSTFIVSIVSFCHSENTWFRCVFVWGASCAKFRRIYCLNEWRYDELALSFALSSVCFPSYPSFQFSVAPTQTSLFKE